MVNAAFSEPTGQGWTQIAELAIAFGLSSLIGLEREIKQKAAGIRTHTVVGLGAALFVLVSKYGFTDVLASGSVVLDPSRVAAQIVSGLGFIGGGIIFVKRDIVRGLTTAATVWLTAAIAAAAAAGLPLLAVVGTIAYFAAILLLPSASRMVARAVGTDRPTLQVSYLDRRGMLRDILQAVTQAGYSVAELSTSRQTPPELLADNEAENTARAPDRTATIRVLLDGRGNLDTLMTVLNEMPNVLSATSQAEPED